MGMTRTRVRVRFRAAASPPRCRLRTLPARSSWWIPATQSVSLISPDGVHAGITTLESAGPGVTVDAGDTAQVILRNLSLISFAATDPGIDALTVGSLHVEHCSVTVFSYGIRFGPSTTGARLYVSDTTIRRSSLGLIVNGGTGVKAMVDGVRIADTLFSAFGFANADALIRNSMAFGRSGNSGFVATGTAKVVIEDSTSAGYSYGFTAADGAVMLVNRSSHAFGYFGMFAESNGSIYASNCTLAGNNTAIFTQTGGVVMTRGDNNLQPNVSTGAFSGNFTTQ